MVFASRFNLAWGTACLAAGVATAALTLSRGPLPATALRMADTPPITAAPAPAPLPLAPFMDFIERLKFDAAAAGIPPATVDALFQGMVPDPEVLELATVQPEHVKSTAEYIGLLVSEARVDAGVAKLQEHQNTLAALEVAYGVDRHAVLAIWGIESNFGAGMGTRTVLRSLSTLAAFDKRRSDFWRTELLTAIRMVTSGDAPADMLGSWAGAMGHTQFMPSTFAKHAVDFDGDGRRDIWGTVPDALASTANYLRFSGWTRGSPWGFEVELPDSFDFAHSAPHQAKTLREWLGLGIVAPAVDSHADRGIWHLILPAGARGPSFLVSANFQAILKYNNSTSYALAVGLLSDRLAGRPALSRSWPVDIRALSRSDREELQHRLLQKGLVSTAVDGVIGGGTKAAIRAYQKTRGLPEDGHADLALLERLRQDNNP